jgi:hypothetical protein
MSAMASIFHRLIFATTFIAGLTAGCGSAHLEAGRRCLKAGNLQVAVELLDQGVSVEPGNQELRQLAIMTRQIYQHGLRQEVDRLVGSGRYLLALGRLVELEELSRRAEQISMPGDLPADVERERSEVAARAVEMLGRALDRRSSRGIPVKADLAVCRQLLALAENDQSVQRTCDRLRSRFKLLAVLEEAPGTTPGTRELFPQIDRLLREKNPELIELTDAASGRHTAVMSFWVGPPVVDEAPWRLKKRDAFFRWVPKLDRNGRQIVETVVVPPTARQIADAKENQRPPPPPKEVRKKVWERIFGEFRVFHSRRSVGLPYRVIIRDLRSQTLAVVFSGMVRSSSESSYYEYSGDPRGETPAPVPYRGRTSAPALLSRRALAERALAELPRRVVSTTLKRVE